MYIQQLYTNCLAEAAYYVESEGEAVIIDPLRDIAPYLELAKARNTTIKYIFETHFHADFVSGHIDLAAKTGAQIVFGPKATPNYTATIAEDGQLIPIGKITFKVLHTPGHTPESSCFLLLDENDKESAVFTGDTLFVGDVGRPDLAVKSDLTREDLAGLLYESLNTKIKPLADDIVVYPAHGAGSACGKNIGKETFSTIGAQKQSNYALQEMTKTQFVAAVTEGLTEPPAYFFHDAMLNKTGYQSFDALMKKNVKGLSVTETENFIKEGVLILDTRNADDFEKGFIPGSVNIGLGGQFAVWVGALINADKSLLLVTDPGKEEEATMRLARVGYEDVKGYLQGGIDSWIAAGKNIDTVKSVTPEEFAKNYSKQAHIIDVRNAGEWNTGIIEGAQLITLSKLEKEADSLNSNDTYYIHCAGGYRSMIAASILKKKGIRDVVNILGGYGKLKEQTLPFAKPELV